MDTNLIQLKSRDQLLFVFLAFLVGSTITSCKKSEKPSLYANADVYVVGTVFGGNKATTATIWKNGVATALTDKTVTSSATGITVVNGVVYVCGSINNNAVYWKNGVLHSLGTGPEGSNASAIAVIGSDVWVIGTTTSFDPSYNTTVYWKNDVMQQLAPDPSNVGYGFYPTGIVGDGNNIIICGWGGNQGADYYTESVYWENQTPLNHLDSLSKHGNQTEAIAQSNGNLYIVGSSTDTSNLSKYFERAILWTNGVKKVLDTDQQDSQAFSIAVSGNDVYVAGQINDRSAGYWKNGNLTILGTGTGILPYAAYAIAVSGNDVYVTGRSGQAVGFWKNGSMIILSSNGLGSGITVVPHVQ